MPRSRSHISWMFMYGAILVLCGISWAKFILTGNLRVDHNPFPVAWSYPIFILFVGSLLLFAIHYWKTVWVHEPATNYKWQAYGVVIIASLMLPFVSNDVIVYLGHGYLSNHGIDVFANMDILKDSVWAPYIDDWKEGPFVYGPINLIPSKMANWVGGENIYLSFAVYKILMLGVGIGIIEMLSKIVTDPRNLLIAALAPAFWLHNVGHMHNDMIACLLV